MDIKCPCGQGWRLCRKLAFRTATAENTKPAKSEFILVSCLKTPCSLRSLRLISLCLRALHGCFIFWKFDFRICFGFLISIFGFAPGASRFCGTLYDANAGLRHQHQKILPPTKPLATKNRPNAQGGRSKKQIFWKFFTSFQTGTYKFNHYQKYTNFRPNAQAEAIVEVPSAVVGFALIRGAYFFKHPRKRER